MSHHMVECPPDRWTSVVVDNSAVFNRQINEWLESNVGSHGVDWAWDHNWVWLESTDSLNWLDQYQLTLVFAQPRLAILFTLRWGDVCQ